MVSVIRNALSRHALRRSIPTCSRQSVIRTNGKVKWSRGYASGGDGHAAPSSDIPWFLAAVAVTVPTCYYLWPDTSAANHHGPGDHHGHEKHSEEEVKDHEETAEESNEEADKDEKPDEKEEKSDDDGEAEEEKSNENAEKDDSEDDKHDGATSNPDIGKASDGKSTEPVKSTNHKVEGVQFKGKTNKGDDNNEMHDTRKIESDGKGGMRKRIDSGYQKDLGAGDRKNEDGSPSGKTAVEPSNDQGAIDTKQKGLSTTATRHSSQIDQDPEKSKKGEGVPETAKSQTTIDPKRPAV